MDWQSNQIQQSHSLIVIESIYTNLFNDHCWCCFVTFCINFLLLLLLISLHYCVVCIILQNCSAQSSESTGPPGSPQEPTDESATGGAVVFTPQPPPYVYPGYMFGAPVYNMNGKWIKMIEWKNYLRFTFKFDQPLVANLCLCFVMYTASSSSSSSWLVRLCV